MGPLCPHLHQLFDSSFNGFGSVFDVCVPDLIGSEASHFQIIVLHDVNSHQPTVIGICLIAAPRIVHVTLDDVENLANQNDSCVSFLPIIVKCSIT